MFYYKNKYFKKILINIYPYNETNFKNIIKYLYNLILNYNIQGDIKTLLGRDFEEEKVKKFLRIFKYLDT